ncbi:hypothetical protein MBLNU230_g1796t1 [Neophaeotheca triangularis]
MAVSKNFNQKMGDWFRYILSCCDKDREEEDERPALQISGPTDFRRHDITLTGLSEEQQRYIREKAIHDAQRMYAHLQPLASSPSTAFAERPAGTQVSYEDFTTPRAAPAVPAQRDSVVGRMRAHSRKISNSLTLKPAGYQAVQPEGSEHEMSGLVNQKGEERRKESGSGDSFLTGTGTGDADSGKEFNRL